MGVSLAYAYAGDATKVNQLLSHARDTGTQYMSLLNHAFSTFSNSRLLAVQKPTVAPLSDCIQSGGDMRCVVYGGVDNFMEGYNYLNDCQIPTYINGGIDIRYTSQVFQCHSTYMKNISDTLGLIETQKQKLQKIVDAAPPNYMNTTATNGVRTSSTSAPTISAISELDDIDYCANADTYDWCDCKTGVTGLSVWPKGDESKKQHLTVDQCYHTPVAIAKVAVKSDGCVQWQCYGQSGALSTCVEGDGDLFLVFHCDSKGWPCSTNTGRMCWARGVEGSNMETLNKTGSSA